MPEQIQHQTVFSLLEVGQSIRKTLQQRYTKAFWVKAEMNKLNYYAHSGHCYPELVEKKDGRVVAQLRAIIWRSNFDRINAHFLESTREPLQDGIKVLFLASIEFDPQHGLSLLIQDIDPSYTLGDLAMEKEQTMQLLIQQKIFSLNQELSFPFLPQRIAIISVETSKGYIDFISMLKAHQPAYAIQTTLFPALLQGDAAVGSILTQLEKIKNRLADFDVVAILRGGGGEVGLSCYNQYPLAAGVATFPLPVITGIGHATNETVTERVAYFNAITPTRLAQFVTGYFDNAYQLLLQQEEKLTRNVIEYKSLQYQQLLFCNDRLVKATNQQIKSEQHQLEQVVMTIRREGRYRMNTETERWQYVATDLLKYSTQFLQEQKEALEQQPIHLLHQVSRVQREQDAKFKQLQLDLKRVLRFQTERLQIRLQHFEQRLDMLRVERTLQRGFSITFGKNGLIRSVENIEPGEVITTQLIDGMIQSYTQETTKNHEQK